MSVEVRSDLPPWRRVPEWVALHAGVSDAAVRCLLVIQKFEDLDRTVSRQEIADLLGWSLSKVKRCILQLEDVGAVTVQRRFDVAANKNLVNRYVIHYSDPSGVGSGMTLGPDLDPPGGVKSEPRVGSGMNRIREPLERPETETPSTSSQVERSSSSDASAPHTNDTARSNRSEPTCSSCAQGACNCYAPADDTLRSSSDAASPDPSVARELCREFALGLIANHPKRALPQTGSAAFEKWIKEMDLLLRVGEPGAAKDGSQAATVDEVRAVIAFATTDPFERDVVLSVPKMRQRFAQLLARASSNGNGKTPVRVAGRVSEFGTNTERF